jgi:hypothetical protein
MRHLYVYDLQAATAIYHGEVEQRAIIVYSANMFRSDQVLAAAESPTSQLWTSMQAAVVALLPFCEADAALLSLRVQSCSAGAPDLLRSCCCCQLSLCHTSALLLLLPPHLLLLLLLPLLLLTELPR